MFFPAEDVLSAFTVELSGEEKTREAAKSLHPPSTDPERIFFTMEFLKRLPSAEEQRKILGKLMELSGINEATIGTFRWWDIMSKETWLFADVQRDGKTVTVSFSWREVEKGKDGGHRILASNGWARDTSVPGGWRHEIACGEYHDMVALFEAWLLRPLKPMPS